MIDERVVRQTVHTWLGAKSTDSHADNDMLNSDDTSECTGHNVLIWYNHEKREPNSRWGTTLCNAELTQPESEGARWDTC